MSLRATASFFSAMRAASFEAFLANFIRPDFICQTLFKEIAFLAAEDRFSASPKLTD
jgi:hypothetical protein